ncbi:hypothetical protein PHMEG_0004700 [Phytophthora megakarya]|uniref:Uncharacterized protein n=1 Tax=Phytophthora megakarya TaxID=4795 RepID=A0A225WUR8_9STRA|nr:hypothetical protein PHMEG_0004700 [Phytophthora megakarya]
MVTKEPYQAPNISAVAENAPNVAGGNRRMSPDQYTREGLSVCGRCHLLDCSRETCRYNNMTCSNCKRSSVFSRNSNTTVEIMDISRATMDNKRRE